MLWEATTIWLQRKQIALIKIVVLCTLFDKMISFPKGVYRSGPGCLLFLKANQTTDIIM